MPCKNFPKTNKQIKEESKEILSSLGYKLLIENVDDGSPDRVFEDWWIDPQVIRSTDV